MTTLTKTLDEKTRSVVKVMDHRQVAIPKTLFEALRIDVGDYLEAEVRAGQLVYTPKSLVDRDIAEALTDIENGRVAGPFRTVKEVMQSLKTQRS